MVIVGSSTLSYFYPTLVAGLGYSAVEAQFMVVPIYAVAFVCVIVTGYFGDKFPKQRGLVISGWLVCSLVCAIAICLVYGYTARYALLVIMAAGLWSTNGCALSYAASTFGDMPRETRAVALALVNALGNLAQIYGYVLWSSVLRAQFTDRHCSMSPPFVPLLSSIQSHQRCPQRELFARYRVKWHLKTPSTCWIYD